VGSNWKNFRSTKEYPSPSSLTYDEADDLKAVVQGPGKPAAIVSKKTVAGNSAVRSMLWGAGREGSGLLVKTAPTLIGGTVRVVGRPRNVRQIVSLLEEAHAALPDRPTERFHRQMGAALGYHPEAIEDYVERVRRRQPVPRNRR